MVEPVFQDVQRADPTLVVDMPYASTANAFGRALYSLNRAFLRTGTAMKLVGAQAHLRRSGLGLVVWDAYRPLAVQRAMWDALPDERFVAPPSRGSRHNRGAAVDVTLALLSGARLPMPTGFDDFSEAAHIASADASSEACANRELLRRAMLAAGFTGIDEEWWHFDDPDFPRYPVCDVPLETLAAQADAAMG